ncbi:molybdopterin molybdenumtransferase MoeA [Mucilaginibacter conchicola]|uniref:Molybdopterin molybdenumtransferase n=1 Tax=Mucilaginibacter conchicola TaxID=2303333 RepID=A0A372NVZ4_9SPHI|nr:molybdopterin molybdotransferase MoeA [Mucilaginibacter conchicola]RFZ94094.1 molybdopterin molybdenumtransferase MoeA [Mucilaginibacter conchicola]
MIAVQEAENIILSQVTNYGEELLPFEQALGKVLAEDIITDRDLPPFNRATVDGIAVSYVAIVNGLNTFRIKATQAAGQEPVSIDEPDECIEIMTGAALHASVDTMIRYEDIIIADGVATININDIKRGQNIHLKGKDKLNGDVIAKSGRMINAAVVSLAASVGKTSLSVKRVPKIVVISSGDELVDAADIPSEYELRRSNNYTIKAILKTQGIDADMMHMPDDKAIIDIKLLGCLQTYDVILLTGGISMGKYDYIPQALEDAGVTKLFHKVAQRPGKPFWFGRHANGKFVFAFPGNPVSVFMCMYRYFLPWLNQSLGLPKELPVYARLSNDFTFTVPLQFFLQVKLNFTNDGILMATPIEGNGSGDFANLADADAFIELTAEQSNFKAGEVFHVWKF